MNNNGSLTIKEASAFLKMNPSSIYKAISEGRIKVESFQIGRKKIKKVKKSELVSVFGYGKTEVESIQTEVDSNRIEVESIPIGIDSTKKANKEADNEQSRIKVDSTQFEVDSIQQVVKKTIEEFFEAKQAELVKPIEQQSLYRLGRIENENEFLRAKVETLLQEIEQYKALPWQIQERDEEIKILETKLKEEKDILETKLLQEKEQALNELKISQQLEKAELEAILKAKEEEKARIKIEKEEVLKKLTSLPAPVESIHQLLLDNANNLKELVTEKTKIENQLKAKNSTIREKEHALKEIIEIHQQEIEKLKLQVEEEKKQIADAWKKELELTKKPWWKFW